MIARELMLLPLVLAGSVAAIAAYLYLFHTLSFKEVGASAAAMTLGVMIGRAWGLRDR